MESLDVITEKIQGSCPLLKSDNYNPCDRSQSAETSSKTQPPPSAGFYRCIVVDPPWDQGKTGIRAIRPNQGRDLEYPTMNLAEIEN